MVQKLVKGGGAHCDYIDNLSPSLLLLAWLELRFVNSPKLCKVKKICLIACHLDGNDCMAGLTMSWMVKA